MKVFYIRVSTEEQNEERQVRMAEDCGAEKIFMDKASGKNTDRAALREMLSFVRENDTVMVESISRIARSTKDLLAIIEQLNRNRVAFVSLKERIDTSTPQGKFMLTVFGTLAELERENILQRQREGIAIAKEKGKYKGRKPMQIDKAKFAAAVTEWKAGKRTAVSVMKIFGISRTTFYRWVKG